jgi:hypothetical protein
MKTIAIFLLVAICAFNLRAQNQNDALRYSQTYFSGTARAMSLGGAMTALGGDLSAMSVNPAACGVFKTTNFAFTTGFNNLEAKSTFNGNSETDNKYKFALDNIGIATAYKTGSETGLVSLNFGIAYNRSNNFDRNMIIGGINPGGSMLSTSLPDDGTAKDGLLGYSFFTQLANSTHLMDTLSRSAMGAPNMWGDVLYDYWGQRVRRTVTTTGGMGQTDLTFGGNVNNKFYFGIGVGLVTLTQEEKIIHTETNTNDNLILRNYSYTQNIKTTGSGYNIKLGFIYTPVEYFRFGASLHTPTFLSFTDKIDGAMVANYTQPLQKYGNATNYSGSLDDVYSSDLTTPTKLTAGIAFMKKELGFISFDIERIDYTKAKLRADNYDFEWENKAIKDQFKAVTNFKVGAEMKVGAVSVRGGAAYYDSPYTDEKRKKADLLSFSGGIGVNTGGFFIDFAYVYSTMENTEFMYDAAVDNSGNLVEPVPTAKYKNSKAVLTLGFRF